MGKKPMTENDVTATARGRITRDYHVGGRVIAQPEASQWDLRRPDLIVIIEYQARNRQWVVHSVESKVDKSYLAYSDYRYIADGVKQASSYKANYRWLAISKEAYNALSNEQWFKLKRDCRRYKYNIGLMVAFKTRADIHVEPGYFPGYYIQHYRDEEWFEKKLGEE